MKIFVTKLSTSTNEQDLMDAFTVYGKVTSANIVLDKLTSRSKGFAFVEMSNEDEALAAIAELHESELGSRTIVVKKAETRF